MPFVLGIYSTEKFGMEITFMTHLYIVENRSFDMDVISYKEREIITILLDLELRKCYG